MVFTWSPLPQASLYSALLATGPRNVEPTRITTILHQRLARVAPSSVQVISSNDHMESMPTGDRERSERMWVIYKQLKGEVSRGLWPFVARRNHSNCSVIELNRTQSNLIVQLGSIEFRNRTQSNQKNCVRVRFPNPIELNRTVQTISRNRHEFWKVFFSVQEEKRISWNAQ